MLESGADTDLKEKEIAGKATSSPNCSPTAPTELPATAIVKGCADALQLLQLQLDEPPGNGDTDEVLLSGLLLLLRCFMHRHPILRTKVCIQPIGRHPSVSGNSPQTCFCAQFGTNLSCVVLRRVLFSAPARPLASRPATRASAYDLLLALAEGGAGQADLLLASLRPLHSPLHGVAEFWVDEWGVDDVTEKRGQHVGLLNLGCTCYMAAVVRSHTACHLAPPK